MNRMHAAGAAALLIAAALPNAGCSTAAIELRETLGFPKRDQLVSRVREARDEQAEAKEQFASALDEFLALTGAEGDPGVAELESRYRTLKSEFDRSQDEADDVRGRIREVQRVAEALFEEWEEELGEYQSRELRRSSERQLIATREQYDKLMTAMREAESKMIPVLAAFNDQVLFLKHNLNARAITSLRGTAGELESEIGTLIREMEASIAQANEFIAQMQAGE